MDDEHLCFLVGDVSGKGVPASLFMAITQTLVKTKATKGLTSATVLNRVNEDLSLDNPSLMFVTLFLGILNIRTGELEYCNGGHNPPYIIRASGDLETVETTNGMALGVVEDFHYQAKKLVLRKGDTIFLYSDGVTEAMNEKDELFTEGRLEKECRQIREEGLAVDDEEFRVGIRCLAAPVRDFSRKVVAATGISGPKARLDDTTFRRLRKQVRKIGIEMSKKLGYVDESSTQ
jgi:serine phosphatase RsbU (regulator of sigma subunit)